MGKRSRKTRPEAMTRAERDERRRQAAAAVKQRGAKDGPPAPWGSFPLTELVVLLALILGIVGMIRFSHHTGKVMVAAAMCLGSLGGLEVSIREHFSGHRSHTTLLAVCCAVGAMVLISVIAGKVNLAVYGIVIAAGVLVFVLCFWALRQAFIRRSGGLGFR